MLSEVNQKTCQAYVACRIREGGKPRAGRVRKDGSAGTAYLPAKPSGAGARRDLEDIRAAINHHAKLNLHRELVNVWLPDKSPPRQEWLTRSEAAALLWVCWRYREVQTYHRGRNKGEI